MSRSRARSSNASFRTRGTDVDRVEDSITRTPCWRFPQSSERFEGSGNHECNVTRDRQPLEAREWFVVLPAAMGVEVLWPGRHCQGGCPLLA
jgi:hypothetical protein